MLQQINFIDTLTPERWESLGADKYLTTEYQQKYNQEELKKALSDRIKAICAECCLKLPTKIVITENDTAGRVKIMNSGELRIHPLTFLACKLDRTMMNEKQKEMYEKLDKYILAKETTKNINTKAPLYPIATNSILSKYHTMVASDLQEYKCIMPTDVLDEGIKLLLEQHKAMGYSTITPTMAKLASIAISLGSFAMFCKGITNEHCIAQMTHITFAAGVSAFVYKGLNFTEKLVRLAALFFNEKHLSLVKLPWNQQTNASKQMFSQLELIKKERMPEWWPQENI